VCNGYAAYNAYSEFVRIGSLAAQAPEKQLCCQGGKLSPGEVVVVFQNAKNISVRMVLIVMLIAGMNGATPTGVSAEKSTEPVSAEKDCDPDSGWMWTDGPAEPAIAVQVQQELSQRGIKAAVEARNYGETDSCGNYHSKGIDFTIRLKEVRSPQPGQADEILPTLAKFGKPNLGNVKLLSAQGQLIPVNRHNKLSFTTTQAMAVETLPANAITKKVYVIAYDQLLSNGQTLSQYMNWSDHASLTQQTIDLFNQASNNRMNFVVVDTTIVTSGWPELIDGFSYTEQEYLAVLSGQQPHHVPTEVDYNKFVSNPQFDICGKVNRGEIDEVWVYNAPWFGFYESRLVGPGAYRYNSPPIVNNNNCTRLIPIMGPSIERTAVEATHNFVHRG
jgi:hypothetical protein